MDRSSAEDGGQDLNAGYPLGRYLKRAGVQDDEVGELARLEGADLVLAVAGEGGVGGVEGQPVACRQALGGPEQAAVAGAAQQGIADADAGVGRDYRAVPRS